jgi:hypothetical protein
MSSPGKHREPFRCSLCGLMSTGWNCNGLPLTVGNCCERCDRERVIPARIREARREDYEQQRREAANKSDKPEDSE